MDDRTADLTELARVSITMSDEAAEVDAADLEVAQGGGAVEAALSQAPAPAHPSPVCRGRAAQVPHRAEAPHAGAPPAAAAVTLAEVPVAFLAEGLAEGLARGLAKDRREFQSAEAAPTVAALAPVAAPVADLVAVTSDVSELESATDPEAAGALA